MSKKDGRDYIFLIWKNPASRCNFVVGELSKNGMYEFRYVDEVKAAISEGFQYLVSFDDPEKTYQSEILFPAFSSRLPDRKRRDIHDILVKYKMESYDEFELLKRSGARLPIDNLEFIDPILDFAKPFSRDFYVAGSRHYLGCNGELCDDSLLLEVGENLYLEREPENEFDKYAVKIMKAGGRHIGYLPRYYSASISNALEYNVKIRCVVEEFRREQNCNECVKVNLLSK